MFWSQLFWGNLHTEKKFYLFQVGAQNMFWNTGISHEAEILFSNQPWATKTPSDLPKEDLAHDVFWSLFKGKRWADYCEEISFWFIPRRPK